MFGMRQGDEQVAGPDAVAEPIPGLPLRSHHGLPRRRIERGEGFFKNGHRY
jgi:hypothetical protein